MLLCALIMLIYCLLILMKYSSLYGLDPPLFKESGFLFSHSSKLSPPHPLLYPANSFFYFMILSNVQTKKN